MNVTDSYMLLQMQQMAAGMTAMPQTSGSKEKDGTSFQDMMEQTTGKQQSTAETGSAAQKPVEKKPAAEEGKDSAQTPETEAANAPVQKEEETLRPENLTANPNVVTAYLDLFRPVVAEAVEGEADLPAPVAAIPEQTVEETASDISGELPTLETAVETGVSPEMTADGQQESFQEVIQAETPQPAQEAAPETVSVEHQEAPAETAVETAAEAPVQQTDVQSETAAAPETDRPEIEVETVSVKPEEKDSETPAGEAVQPEQTVFHETKATPVKVGERYETVDTEQPDMDEKLANTIRQTVQSGGDRVEIRLTPANLGTLTIEMTKDASGTLQVVLHASNSRAAGLLNQHLDSLHAALQNYGQEQIRVEVQRTEESQQQHLHQQADPDGRGQQHQPQQERRQEHTGGQDFLQKLRLGLFGTEETPETQKGTKIMSDFFGEVRPDIVNRYTNAASSTNTNSTQKTENDWLLPGEEATESTRKSNSELTFEDMLLLMVTQLQNQTIDNQADTNDMMNQLIQMTVMQAMTEMSAQVEELTTANVMSYSASLVGKDVTVGVLDEKGELAEEIYGTVTATGTYNGQQVIFLGDKYYPLSSIMAVGKLPETAVDGNDTTVKPTEPTDPTDPEEPGENGGVDSGENAGAVQNPDDTTTDNGGTDSAGSDNGTEGIG